MSQAVDREALLRRLMATFIGELEEHVRTLNGDLLLLEKDPEGTQRAECLARVFRAAHSLKGAARSVSLAPIESACHRMEEDLASAREGTLALTPELFARLFETVDALDEAGRRLRSGADLSGSAIESVAAGVRAVPKMASTAEPARPMPVPAKEARRDPVAAVPRPSAPRPNERGEEAATVRITPQKLDDLINWTGELLVARRRVADRPNDLAELRGPLGRAKEECTQLRRSLRELLDGEPGGAARSAPHPAIPALGRLGAAIRDIEEHLARLGAAMKADSRTLEQTAVPLDEAVRRARMLPFVEACQGLDRMVRDLAQKSDKEAELVMEGGDVELDRTVIERLRDPLRHIVRNAVDHGVEQPQERARAGKGPVARVAIRAMLRGGHVEVSVEDDGKGLDLAAIRAQAKERNLGDGGDGTDPARLIFLPGFSTAGRVTDVSGRGVGLDVVKSRIESLHGSVEVSSDAGRGTRFLLTVPLTLTILRALLVQAGGQTFALASNHVNRLARLRLADVKRVGGRDVISLGGHWLPVASLAAALGSASPGATEWGEGSPVLVVDAPGETRMALVVDDLVSEQEVMIKTLGRRIRRARYFSGATILSSGEVALVLNAGEVVRNALPRAAAGRAAAPAERPAKKRLVLADDSITTRTVEKTILEAAGYDVVAAADGEAAWRLLQERGADLLVSDVDMPRMDGFTLTQTVRRSERFRELPVVLVTGRESEADKAHGIEVGADAYVVKSGFDQRSLLETIAQLL